MIDFGKQNRDRAEDRSFVFRVKRIDRVKLIYLEGAVAAQLSALLEGLNWKRLHSLRGMQPQIVAESESALHVALARRHA